MSEPFPPNNAPEQESDIGLDEAYTINLKSLVEGCVAGVNQVVSELAAQQRRNAQHYDTLIADSRDHNQQLRNISVQALQNAVENANFSSKQYLQDNKAKTIIENGVLVERNPKEEGEGTTPA